MKATILPEHKHKVVNHSIRPYSVSNALIGLQMDGVDDEILKYIDFWSSKIPIDHACFLHVVNRPDIFNVYEMESSPFNGVELDEDLMLKLGRVVKSSIKEGHIKKISPEVAEGNPLEELLEKADHIKADLVVIGQNSESRHHGILAKNLARQVWSNALLVPDKATLSLQNLLVPIDFSIHSAEALRIAVAIRKQLQGKARITLAHVYEMPANYSAYRFNESKVLRMIEEERMESLHHFVKEHLPEDEQKGLETDLIKRNHQSIGHNVVGFAEKYGHDLIVMGAKGHSKLALLLMGSVTEKVISHSKQVPVLVVK